MWEIDNTNQIITFLLSLCQGAVFCLLYDLIRAARKVCFNSFWSVFVTDIFVCILYAFGTFIFLIARTNGEIRGFVLVGETLGFVVFRITFSRLLFPIFCFIFTNTALLIRKFTRVIYGFNHKFEILIIKIVKNVSEFFKSAKKLLKNALKLLYTNRNNANTEKILDETKTKA